MHYKKQSEFYRNLLELIVAVIIGQSFFQVDNTFIPLTKVFESERGLVDASGVFLSYFIVITGWIGYHRSITKDPHRNGLGNIRFIIDLAIVFLTYYIVNVSDPESKGKFGEIFQWILPTMFGLYLLWDFVKFLEYRDQRDEHKTRISRMVITLAFFSIFVTIQFYYNNQLSLWPQPFPTNPPWNKTHFDFAFVIISFIIVLLYRMMKWQIKGKLPRLRQNPKVDEGSNKLTDASNENSLSGSLL